MDFYGVSLFNLHISLSSFIALLTPQGSRNSAAPSLSLPPRVVSLSFPPSRVQIQENPLFQSPLSDYIISALLLQMDGGYQSHRCKASVTSKWFFSYTALDRSKVMTLSLYMLSGYMLLLKLSEGHQDNQRGGTPLRTG